MNINISPPNYIFIDHHPFFFFLMGGNFYESCYFTAVISSH